AVVGHGHGRAVLVQHDGDAVGMLVHRLVDRVVDDLPDEVMEAGRVDAADVHAGTPAHGLEPLEHQDVLRRVARRHQLALTAATPPRLTTRCPLPPPLPAGAARAASPRSPPSGVTTLNS